jgi:cation diffusion facilitator CzcD-associated flavoprotein CzcO
VSEHRNKHAIIGAGFSGLGVAAAFRRAGIDFDVLEADDEIGGNWYHGVYETAHIISSRRTTQYSDFPMPEGWPDFPSAAQILTYLRAYADHHELRPRIELRTRVAKVAPAGDGTWEITLDGGERRVYGGVVVCNGHHWDRRMPEYPGAYAGETIHSKDYKTPERLRGRRVLVIGGGNSACDIAVEAARFAVSSHISMRRGYWFMPKTMMGVPTVELMKPWMPLPVQRAFIKSMVRMVVGRYEDYGLAHPDHEPFEKHPTINSELLHSIRHGRVKPHPDVARFDGDAVEFTDGKREPIDLVVAATGYRVSFPFVAEGVVAWKDGMPQLIGGVVPPGHRNIYFFGLGQPRYGAGPLITAGADLLCTMVATQRQLQHPIGELLRRMGQKPPRTFLQDPFRLLRQVKLGKHLIPRLPSLEPLLAR